MFPILVLLLFLPPSSGTTIQTLSSDCRIGQKAECEKAIFVPGHSLLGQGVNIVTMEKTRSYLINMEEYINPQETCKLCRNPHTNEWNKVPKSMVNWIPINSYKASVISKTDDSVVSLAKEESSSVQNDWSGGLSIKYKALSYDTVVAGSNSKVTQFAESKSRTNKYKFIRQQVESSLYSFQVAGKYSLNSHFFDEVKNLPNTYNRSTEQRYMSFIQEFGTHYISKAEVGGRGMEVIAVKVCEVEMKGMDMEEVKSCLSSESKASVEGNTSGSIQAKLKECEQSAKKYNYGVSYHKSFNERFSKVIGGVATFDLFKEGNVEQMNSWLATLKTQPDAVKYSLEPIHKLSHLPSPMKSGLGRAVADYINKNVLKKDCSCRGNSRRERGDCSCTCNITTTETKDCCPKQAGAARVQVTVQRAINLYGDTWSQTDAYVKFIFGDTARQTWIVHDNDNPIWNAVLDLGTQDLTEGKRYRIEVWDEDDYYLTKRYDLLGKCEKQLASGDSQEECYLDHGMVKYRIRATCSSHLAGKYCETYQHN